MNLRTWSATCLMTLVLATTAWSQSSSTDTTGTATTPDVSSLLGAAAGTPTTQPSIKQQLRSEMILLVTGEIHNIFTDLRTSLGLPAEPTDPTTDFLSILETIVTDMVQAKLEKQ
jgi:hypothetical protein